jgi:hypothetical protein
MQLCLPQELLGCVFGFLRIDEVCVAHQACKRWNNTVAMWRKLNFEFLQDNFVQVMKLCAPRALRSVELLRTSATAKQLSVLAEFTDLRELSMCSVRNLDETVLSLLPCKLEELDLHGCDLSQTALYGCCRSCAR